VNVKPDLKIRTKQFALRVIRLFRALPRNEEARVLGKQLLRSATSVGSNYRGACRSRSRAEFIAKLGVVLEEADNGLLAGTVVRGRYRPPCEARAIDQGSRRINLDLCGVVANRKGPLFVNLGPVPMVSFTSAF
jgi:hypothetical protein